MLARASSCMSEEVLAQGPVVNVEEVPDRELLRRVDHAGHGGKRRASNTRHSIVVVVVAVCRGRDRGGTPEAAADE